MGGRPTHSASERQPCLSSVLWSYGRPVSPCPCPLQGLWPAALRPGPTTGPSSPARRDRPCSEPACPPGVLTQRALWLGLWLRRRAVSVSQADKWGWETVTVHLSPPFLCLASRSPQSCLTLWQSRGSAERTGSEALKAAARGGEGGPSPRPAGAPTLLPLGTLAVSPLGGCSPRESQPPAVTHVVSEKASNFVALMPLDPF